MSSALEKIRFRDESLETIFEVARMDFAANEPGTLERLRSLVLWYCVD